MANARCAVDHDANMARPVVCALAGGSQRSSSTGSRVVRAGSLRRQAWLGIVSFEMTNVAPRAAPALPGISAFPEINVCTYVRVNGKPGVYFFSLDAANPLAVWVARTFFHLPVLFSRRSMSDTAPATPSSITVKTGGEAAFHARYGPTGAAAHPVKGSLDYFLTERYCLYTVDRERRRHRLDIHHPPWPLRPAAADIRVNTLAQAAGIQVPSFAPLVHFAKRQDVVNWPPRREPTAIFSTSSKAIHRPNRRGAG